jgi:hypothetical protein
MAQIMAEHHSEPASRLHNCHRLMDQNRIPHYLNNTSAWQRHRSGPVLVLKRLDSQNIALQAKPVSCSKFHFVLRSTEEHEWSRNRALKPLSFRTPQMSEWAQWCRLARLGSRACAI